MAKQVAVKARYVGDGTFFRCGKDWSSNGSTHLVDQLDLARLRQEQKIIVISTADTIEELDDAARKAGEHDSALLKLADGRAKRLSIRKSVVSYDKPDAIAAHVAEIKRDMAEEGVTSYERESLALEMKLLEKKLKSAPDKSA